MENGAFYTGYAKDLVVRIGKHKNKKGARLTRSFEPKSLFFAWKIFGTRSDAMRIEAAVKKFTRIEKLLLPKSPSLLSNTVEKPLLGCAVPLEKKEIIAINCDTFF